MAKSKPRKKYNAGAVQSKSLDRLVRKKAPHVLIAYCASEGSEFSRLFDREGNKLLPVRGVVDRLKTMHFPWTVTAVVICKDKDGKSYIRDGILEPEEHEPRNFAYVQAVEKYGQKHRDLMRSCNFDHIASYGWVASPMGDEADPDLVMRIMESLGGFESPAQWEIPGILAEHGEEAEDLVQKAEQERDDAVTAELAELLRAE